MVKTYNYSIVDSERVLHRFQNLVGHPKGTVGQFEGGVGKDGVPSLEKAGWVACWGYRIASGAVAETE